MTTSSIVKSLKIQIQEIKQLYPLLTDENIYRIMLLYYGVNYKNKNSFPDPFTRMEIMYSFTKSDFIPIITLLRPGSPFTIIDQTKEHLLLFKDEFFDRLKDLDVSVFDLRKEEPFYFFVKEINGNIVLKLNPRQLCDFFQNTNGNLPCYFCFRNDMIPRFKNIDAKGLIEHIIKSEKKNKSKLLGITDEVSLITGSYDNDVKYIKEIATIVSGLRKYIPEECRIAVGSHEGKGKENFNRLKSSGVTDFAFPVESFDDEIRKKQMRNRKGSIPVEKLLEDIKSAVEVFGLDHVIIRVIAGMGDKLDDNFRSCIRYISQLGENNRGPRWNINIYMPYTHLLWREFAKKPFFTLDYLFEYCHILNQYIPKDRFYRFKISP